jgi:hypothetical protein
VTVTRASGSDVPTVAVPATTPRSRRSATPTPIGSPWERRRRASSQASSFDARRLPLFVLSVDPFDVHAHDSVSADPDNRPELAANAKSLTEERQRTQRRAVLVGASREANYERVRGHSTPRRSVRCRCPSRRRAKLPRPKASYRGAPSESAVLLWGGALPPPSSSQ